MVVVLLGKSIYYFLYDPLGTWYITGILFQVDPANVRPIPEGAVDALVEAEKVAEATKQAIKRKIAQAAVADFQSKTLPSKLQINPDDPEDVVSIVSLDLFSIIWVG